MSRTSGPRHRGAQRMTAKTENVKRLIESLSAEELQALVPYLRSKLPKHALEGKWQIGYDLILDAIFRAQDITQRGVRGVIAEAIFETKIIPTLHGWRSVPIVGDLLMTSCYRESQTSARSESR